MRGEPFCKNGSPRTPFPKTFGLKVTCLTVTFFLLYNTSFLVPINIRRGGVQLRPQLTANLCFVRPYPYS